MASKTIAALPIAMVPILPYMLRRACVRAFASPFAQDWQSPEFNRPKPIVNYVVFRETSQVHFAAYPARFIAREKYMYIKDRGSLMVEFIPKETSLSDPTRKSLLIKDKKVTILHGEDFQPIIHFKGDFQLTKKYKDQLSNLHFKQTSEGVHVTLSSAETSSQEALTREIVLRPSEFYLVQRYLEYALPYVMGWYALANSSLAEQNLSYEAEPRANPFEKI